MAHKRTFAGVKQGDRVKFDDYLAGLMRQHVAAFNDGDRVDVTIGPAESKRSQRANAYYHVVLSLIAKETGNEAPALHDFFCDRLLLTEQKQVAFWNALTGEQEFITYESQRRSSALTTHEFYDYVEGVRAIAAQEMSVTTPDPDPDYQADRSKAEANRHKARRAA